MDVVECTLDDVKLITPKVYHDSRGFFLESFNHRKYEDILGSHHFVQDNTSFSFKNVLRGMHFQKHNPQGKLIQVMSGSIYDVIIDLRKNSSTYLCWEGFYLDGETHKQLWIPPGFAHGFLTLSEHVYFSYKCTEYYNPSDECCLIWNDPLINIEWPISEDNLIISEKDSNGLFIKELLEV
ncbi:dTDP-4-dehydrorhamnose 3,5-epimerase [Citrobacter freundii]|nr:dTDP-4-dehydrorhamnose 3,5-epimerase [Citrobacter freundii]